MKQFTKIIFASMFGTFMALTLLFFLTIGMLAGLAGSGSKSGWEPEVGAIEEGSILTIRFNGPLKDHVKRRDLVSSIFNYDEPPVTGLFELNKVLEKASNDERIKGVLLKFEGFDSGMANLEALRRSLVKFKSSGKFLLSYSEAYSEKAYVLASTADEVILYPKGFFEWNGLFGKYSYLKNTLKKLDVVPQVFRVGKYKSAIEPFIAEKMSDASREQVNGIIEGMWTRLVGYAAEKTGKSPETLNELADNMTIMFGKDALENGFVNLLASFEEVEEKLKELSGAEEKPKYVTWRRYYKELKEDRVTDSENQVAVIFASGGIGTEDEDGEGISSQSLTKLIHKIRRDEKVKAVVIRVNSPGGSALASDVIWTATQWLKDSKPVVTSFGNVAASGGYYMSAGSQFIFAEPTTITGSIGVFGLTFATEKFWNKNIGMTFDTVKSHQYADLESVVRELRPDERAKIQGVVDSIYEDFLSVVINGRQSLQDRPAAHEIAQGRVWIGSTAKEIGLVDELGGLNEAVEKAAEIANLSEYQVEVFPKELSPFEEFFKQMGDVSTRILSQWIPAPLKKVMKQDQTSLHDRVMTRLPFDIEVK